VQQEYDYVVQEFGYPDGYVKKLGLCRFDNLHGMNKPKRQILIMPTWRSWIAPPSNRRGVYKNIESLKTSDYCIRWNNLIHNQKISDLLARENIQVVFYQHNNMQKFRGLFTSNNPNLIVADDESFDVQKLLIESAYLITDYSSVAMDFAYMKKPLSYYQFDEEEFREKHYSEGYFSYEKDGFGPVMYKEEQMVAEIERIINTGFDNDDLYLSRHKEFFDIYDDRNCERNFLAIKEI
jgi:CDP-glycerol glycerophosphotransferase (TagB/SpsB family)